MIEPGKNFPSSPAYFPTPDTIPGELACRVFRVPDSEEWLGALMGAVAVLSQARNWYPWGSLTVDEAADAWNEIINEAYLESLDGVCPVTTVDTPFWDEDSTVNDEEERDVQTWYGYVTDLDSPTTTFVEDAAIWAFTGLLVVAGAPGAAIAFHTVAPRFVVAVRRGELGEIIRLYLDGEEAAEVDTSGYSEGDVIEIPMFPDPEIETGHDMMIVKVS